MKPFITAMLCLFIGFSFAQSKKNMDYPKSLANYEDFKRLLIEVESHRAARLINLDTFNKMAKQKDVIILDTRAKERYDRKHIKGAIHLSFTEFTQENLDALIPNKNTTILIYCNNNFQGDPIDFASKVALPTSFEDTSILSQKKPTTLALNIPTFINLYGYGYKNVYELDELVTMSDRRIKFEGSEVFELKQSE